ncbi:MAG: sensor domain-containing diguanylate cyclase, partial [Gammaproteobacteria bacterium]|nr:sensor domain-containing diguanylate cyclase [Gammaproteobacteria bacterium]
MKNKKPTLSLRRRILLMFIISLFISVAGYGALIFTNWVSSARNTTAHIAADINEEIYNRIDTLIQGPYHTNEVNHKVIKNKMLDWSDENQRDRFFVGVLESHSNSTYSFSYGTANGEYYGARRNKDGVVEIMRNNAETGGKSWYYSVNE